MRRWLARWGELFGRRRRERELEAELASNLELHVEELERAGTQKQEARRLAALKLGGIEQVREHCRERRGWIGLENFVLDLRYAARSLGKAPGLVVVVVLTLALGVGFNCAAFSLAWAAIFRPLPYPEAKRLVWISATDNHQLLPNQPAVSPDQLRAWRPELEQMFSGYAWVSRGGDGASFRVRGFAMQPMERSTSGNLFPLLGVRPALGRLFRAADFDSGHVHVVVISNAFWRQVYGGDPHVIGQTIVPLTGFTPYTIVGVLPASFHLDQPTDLWLPAAFPYYAQLHAYPLFNVLGRRRPGVSVSAVQARIVDLERRNPLETRNMQRPPQYTFQAAALHDVLAGPWRRQLWLLLGAAGCLLLLACLNIANLLLARGRQREPELALRLTLGCPPARLARQLLLESGLLALAGSAGGLLGAAAGLRLLEQGGRWLLPHGLEAALAQLNLRAVAPAMAGWALLAALAAVLLFGLAPALGAARLSLRARVAGRSRIGRAPHLLVAAQAALATALVVGAALLLHSFVNLATTNPGFEAQNRITFDVEMPDIRCPSRPCATAVDVIPAYLDGLMQRVRALPGVAAAAGITDLPLSDDNSQDFGTVPERYQNVFPTMVTQSYFGTLGIPLLRGRNFNAGDRTGTPKKIIVNQAFVDAYFPGQEVLGRALMLPRCEKGFFGNTQAGCTVIGVVGNVRAEALALTPQPNAYIDMAQDPALGFTFVLRTSSPDVVLPELNRLLHALPPVPNGGLPFVFPPRTLGATVAASIASPRFRTWLAGLFAILALGLAAVGIYGVESHAVSRRRHEIGVRVALGASRAELRRWVLGEALRWTLLGVAIGLPLALVASRMLTHWLYQMPNWDPVAALGAPMLLVGVALLGAWRPAQRAMAVDPIEVLRAE